MNTRIIRAAFVATLGLAATASFADTNAPFQGEASYAARGAQAGTPAVQSNVTPLINTGVPTDLQAAATYEPRGEYANEQTAEDTPVNVPVVAQRFVPPYQGTAAWAPRGGS